MELNYIGRWNTMNSFYNLLSTEANRKNNIYFGKLTTGWNPSIDNFSPAVNTLYEQCTAGSKCSSIKARLYLVTTTVPSGFTLRSDMPSLDSPTIGDHKYVTVQYNGQTYYAVDFSASYIATIGPLGFNLYCEIHFYTSDPFTFRQIGFNNPNGQGGTSYVFAYENIRPQTVTTSAEGLTLKLVLSF